MAMETSAATRDPATSRRGRTSRHLTPAERRARAVLLVLLSVVPTGCGLSFDFDGFHAKIESVVEAGAFDAGSDDATSPTSKASVALYGTYRAWSDGTYAPSCEAYLHPRSSAQVYEGAIGSGIYAVRPVLALSPIHAYCDMTPSGEGWTLITTSRSDDRTAGTATTQTSECVTQTSYCNVAAQAWDYTTLRQTWSDCPGAEARIEKTAFQDDTNACMNPLDSLLLTVTSTAEKPGLDGIKSWNDCSNKCWTQSVFAGRFPLFQLAEFPTLVSDAKFVTSTKGLESIRLGGGNCGREIVVSHGCGSGHDNLWVK